MSMKFEKTDVRHARSRRYCGVSSVAMIGVRNSCLAVNGERRGSEVSSQRGTYFVNKIETLDVRSFGFVKLLDNLTTLCFGLLIRDPMSAFANSFSTGF
jgi:hypothetical protein